MRLLDRLWSGPPSRAGYDVDWVGQEEGNGCLVACTAMLLKLSYWSARSLFLSFDPKEGLASSDGLRALGEYGWAWCSKYEFYSPENRKRRRWPVEPFAPVHLVSVRRGGFHAVLLRQDGTVLDPLTHPSHGELTLDRYEEVHEIHGLWRVG